MELLVVDQNGIEAGLNSHGTDVQLELYALKRLPETEVPAIEEHLLVCAVCRDRLDTAAQFALGMREASARTKASSGTPVNADSAAGLGSFLRRPTVSMALAFVALLIVVGLFSGRSPQFAPSASLQLTATRGEVPLASPARMFNLLLTDGPENGGPFRVEVLSASGATMWAGLAARGASGVEVQVTQKLLQGDYFVRLYTPDGKLLRQYGFRVR
jgi:preprotein translocase subunit SecG